MIRKIICVVALAAAAGAAWAASEFPYYPEYADLFSQYDEVTPVMAKKVAIASPHFNNGPDEIVCEPLLIKDIAGKPLCYMVASYHGSDLNVVSKWNNVIEIINTGRKTRAADLAREVAYFYGTDLFRDFSGLVIGPHTLEGTVLLIAEGFFPVLAGFNGAYEAAARITGNGDLYFSRIIGASYYTVQIFEFEDGDGEKVAIMVDKYLQPRLADLSKNAADMHGLVKHLYESYTDNPEKAEFNREDWENTLERVADDVAADEYPRIPPRGAKE